MSSTRTSKDKTVFHQSRYASSPEFERGLLAYLVAKRCAVVESGAERELIWFIQHLSHQNGGLAGIANELIAKHPDRLQTREMAELKLKPGKTCNADQVRKLRDGAPDPSDFILKGETFDRMSGGFGIVPDKFDDSDDYYTHSSWASDFTRAATHPACYSSDEFFEQCKNAAANNLEKELAEICLDPSRNLRDDQPWYFPRLIETLIEFKNEYVKRKSAGIVTTALGKKVTEVLDYTAYSRGLTLMQGEARMGKSFAARIWCEQHPGLARFVEVPPSNDEASFFRALARGLGIGSFLRYKVTEIRERVESVLLSGDLLLVLDEGHRLWPQRNLRFGFPSRINWVMSMANHNVPICAIATPQFIQWQKAAEEKGQWNSAQLTGRINHYESLPTDLSLEDLMAIAGSILPEASANVLRALAVYARSSARYLAAIDSISKRARYIAKLDGRDTTTTTDVRNAMQESVIPADTKLQRALLSGRKRKIEKLVPEPSAPEFDAMPEKIPAAGSRMDLAAETTNIRRGNLVPLVST